MPTLHVREPILLEPRDGPFNFELSLNYFKRRAGELVDQVDGGAYRRALVVEGETVLIEARGVGQAPDNHLAVRLLSGRPDRLSAAAAALRRSLGLDDDLNGFDRAVAADQPLAALIERRRGLRLVRTQTPFEALIWAVIGQQINLTFAFRLKGDLVRNYGERISFDGRSYWVFPLPQRLADADEAALAASGLGRRKATTIRTVARLVGDGDLDLAALAGIDRSEAMRRLTALPGIGPWTAAYTLLRGLGDFGACPSSDLGLRAGVGRLYDDGPAASTGRVEALAATWGAWRGYVAFYLWNSG